MKFERREGSIVLRLEGRAAARFLISVVGFFFAFGAAAIAFGWWIALSWRDYWQGSVIVAAVVVLDAWLIAWLRRVVAAAQARRDGRR